MVTRSGQQRSGQQRWLTEKWSTKVVNRISRQTKALRKKRSGEQQKRGQNRDGQHQQKRLSTNRGKKEVIKYKVVNMVVNRSGRSRKIHHNNISRCSFPKIPIKAVPLMCQYPQHRTTFTWAFLTSAFRILLRGFKGA